MKNEDDVRIDLLTGMIYLAQALVPEPRGIGTGTDKQAERIAAALFEAAKACRQYGVECRRATDNG